MLFDLIKCHAVLHVFQRKKEEDGTIIASRDDFKYARRLYLALNGDVGGQETKLTQNESAVLATLIRMDLHIFTIRQLQDALGFSYYQTYRLLHGYTNSRATYLGILDKCPAISPIDATVAEEIGGIECRKREHYFSFDSVLYRGWSIQADVWLAEGTDDDDIEDDGGDDGGDPDDRDDDDSDCILSSQLHRKNGGNANENEGRSAPHFTREIERGERSTESIGTLHTSGETYPGPAPSVSACAGGCVPGAGAKQTPVPTLSGPFENSGPQAQKTRCKSGCNTSAGRTKVHSGRVSDATGETYYITLSHDKVHISSYADNTIREAEPAR